MNLIHLLGFLGADPEERFTPGGQKLWTLRLATRTFKNGQEDTIWWRITVWGDQFDKVLSHFKKGKPIYIVAEMGKFDIYTDKNGQPQVSYEATARSIHFVPSLGERSDQQDPSQGGGQRSGTSSGGGQRGSYGQSTSQGYAQGSQGQGFNDAGFVQPHNPSDTGSKQGPMASAAGAFSEDEPMPF